MTGSDGSGTLPGVIDDADGESVTSLQFTQEGEQRSDLAPDLLIAAVQADERIEDHEPRIQGGGGSLETRVASLEIGA